MLEPFTIRIFVPEGDPEGVRVIDRMNWTGRGVVFPRSEWSETRKRDEFSQTGIYILVGYAGDDDLPTLYIGQTDDLRRRIGQHYKAKEFWDWSIVFVSTSGGLNRAHVTWLEWALVQRALEADRSRIDNSTSPQEPTLTESEKADTRAFLREIHQILPLVGLRAFEFPKTIASATQGGATETTSGLQTDKDTIIVPAQRDGFERVFLAVCRVYCLYPSKSVMICDEEFSRL